MQNLLITQVSACQTNGHYRLAGNAPAQTKQTAMRSAPLLSRILPASLGLAFLILSACEPAKPSHETKDALAGIEFWLIDQDDRLMITQEILHAIESRYAPLAIKEHRLGISFSAMREQFLLQEQQISDPPPLPAEEAAANLNFIDRTRQRIAALEDTHFSLATILPMPFVWTPINIQFFDHKYFLVGYSEGLKQYLLASGQGDAQFLSAGLELIAIDGADVQILAQALATHIPSSSPNYRQRRAARALSFRNYSYPSQAQSLWTFRMPDGTTQDIALPWLYRPAQNLRRDALYFLKEAGIPSQNQFAQLATQVLGSPISIAIDQGQSGEIAPLRFQLEQEYSVEGSKTLFLGTWEYQGKAHSVIQLKSFSPGEAIDSNGDKFASTMAAIVPFLKNSLKQNRPIILDLRQNSGGSPQLANELFSMFMPADTEFGSLSLAHRITRQVRQMLDAQNRDLSDSTFSTASIAAMKAALNSRSEYTEPYEELRFKTHSDINGFHQSLVVLLDSYCISACDRAAAYFKHYGIGTLIGTHSNGTGAGFSYLTERATFTWRDSSFLFETTFPNRLFGLPLSDQGTNQLLDTNIENRPIQASIEFQPSLTHMLALDNDDSLLEFSLPWL